MSLLWSILSQAIRRRDQVAVEDDRRHYTYKQILGGAMFLAEKIESATAARHVGIMLPTSGAFPIALLGAWLAGRVAVPLNYLLLRDELRYIITDSDVDTVITARVMIEHLGGESIIPPGVQIIYIEDLDFTGVPPLRWPPMPGPDDIAVLLYTSGTSAKPKGVILTHGNLESNVLAAIFHARVTSATGFLGVLPQFHSFGLTALTLIPLHAGSRIIYTARFIPKRIVELIQKHKPSILMFVPSMYGALLSVKDANPESFKDIEVAVSGGEALPNAILEEFDRRFDVRLLEGYGLTETSPVLTWSTPWNRRLHSVGLPLPNVTILIVDEQGQLLPHDKDGEILAAGPNIMKGYYKLPKETKNAFTELDVPDPAGGTKRLRCFRTGDIGHLDEAGFLFITGRKKEMLKVAGEIVFPREIEELLSKHPSVRAVAIIGKTDGLRGEVPVAFVEINDDQPFDENALRTWCRQSLAPFKVPREIRRIDLLPRTPTGKILKRQLRAD